MKIQRRTKKLSSTISNFIFFILLTSSLFITFHTSLHNSFDKNHDSSCPVYVLEELYSAMGLPSVDQIFTFFIAFIFIAFEQQKYNFQAYSYFSIRDPPQAS